MLHDISSLDLAQQTVLVSYGHEGWGFGEGSHRRVIFMDIWRYFDRPQRRRKLIQKTFLLEAGQYVIIYQKETYLIRMIINILRLMLRLSTRTLGFGHTATTATIYVFRVHLGACHSISPEIAPIFPINPI